MTVGPSETGRVLRQRGLGIAAGGFFVQLISMPMVMHGAFRMITLLLFFAAAAMSVMTFTTLKNHTGTSNKLEGAMAVAAIISATIGRTGPTGVILLLIGVAVAVFGNKQLAAGLKA